MTAPTIDQRTMGKQRVVYLLGAGATQGAIKFYGSSYDTLMPQLSSELLTSTKEMLEERFPDQSNLVTLMNSVAYDEMDFEQFITFLEESVSATHREFADEMKLIFSQVLRSRLDKIREELGSRHSQLYATLIDLYNLEEFDETLRGFLTLNYDDFLEKAIEEQLGGAVDYGVAIEVSDSSGEGHDSDSNISTIRVLKLHGSFSWSEHWPIELSGDDRSLWIAPGIRKLKTEYPFNTLWGLAREMLDCDVVRVIGCNLGPNDWDLISLLFTTKHLNAFETHFTVEMITDYKTADRVKNQFPYLDVKHFIELDDFAPRMVGELLRGEERPLNELTDAELHTFTDQFDAKVSNPFGFWLRMKSELVQLSLPTMATEFGLVERLLSTST